MVGRSLVTIYANGRPFHRFQRQRLNRNPLHLAFARHLLGPQQHQLQPAMPVASHLSKHQVG
jgi:hypothetical protein